MRLVSLTLEEVGQRWKDIRGHIQQLAELSNGRQTIQTIADLIRKGTYKVWIIEDEAEENPSIPRATLLTEITEFPTGLRVGGIRGCAGKGKSRWKHLLRELHSYFEQYGCGIVEVHGRAGWEIDAKLAGYKRTAMVFEAPVKSEALEQFSSVSRETLGKEKVENEHRV